MMKHSLTKPVIALIALVTVFGLLSPTLATADESIVGAEHWVQSVSGADGKPLKLYVWEKRLKGRRSVGLRQVGEGRIAGARRRDAGPYRVRSPGS